jgi:hypothetical protein
MAGVPPAFHTWQGWEGARPPQDDAQEQHTMLVLQHSKQQPPQMQLLLSTHVPRKAQPTRHAADRKT